MTTGFSGLDPCVHCGFCLSACPTYEVSGDEADSPRGRIVLMRALARGEMSPSDAALQAHLDSCLGCRGCESVCPSGVIFGPALEESRTHIAEVRPLPPAMRAALWVLARPSRQQLLWLFSRIFRATGLPRLLSRGAGQGAPAIIRSLAMLAASSPMGRPQGAPLHRADPAGAAPMGRSQEVPPHRAGSAGAALVAAPSWIFRGCVQAGLFAHVHDATIVACERNGIAVGEAGGQVCCGALAAHAGADGLARELARENIAAFQGDAEIVVNSAGCGAMLKSYGRLLSGEPGIAERARAFSARVRDVSEVLADKGPVTGTRALPLRVAYDAPCHLVHAQRITQAPLQVLAAVPGIELVPLEGSERCCGSAGLYSMIEPAMSRAVLERKLAAIAAAAPDVVATGNPGCIMQIGGGVLLDGMDVEVRHPVELLAWSYRS